MWERRVAHFVTIFSLWLWQLWQPPLFLLLPRPGECAKTWLIWIWMISRCGLIDIMAHKLFITKTNHPKVEILWNSTLSRCFNSFQTLAVAALKAVAERGTVAPADGDTSLPCQRGQLQCGDQRVRLVWPWVFFFQKLAVFNWKFQLLCSKSLLDDREFIYVYIIIIYIYIIFRIIGWSSSLVGMPFLTNWYKGVSEGFGHCSNGGLTWFDHQT